LEAQEIELYSMSLLEAGFLPLQGFLNTSIYIFTSGIYRDFLHFFYRRRLYRSLYAASVSEFPALTYADTCSESDLDDSSTSSRHCLISVCCSLCLRPQGTIRQGPRGV
jgi:hypothetical protein